MNTNIRDAWIDTKLDLVEFCAYAQTVLRGHPGDFETIRDIMVDQW